MNNQTLKDSRYASTSEQIYSDLTLYYCGFQRCPPFHSNSRVRDFYVIHYVLSGKGAFRINDTTYNLSKGQGFLICPGILTNYRSDSEDPWTYCWFSFNGTKVKYFLEQLGLGNETPVFKYDKDDFLEKCIMNMIDAKNITSGRNFYLQSQMYLFFYKLADSLTIPLFINNSESNGKLYTKRVIDFIERNYSEKITIEELASYVGISRKHLFRLFKENLHTSPQSFLINYRINRACELLSNPLLNIREVAHSVGYEDALLFSKIFKKIKKKSPKEYRKDIV